MSRMYFSDPATLRQFELSFTPYKEPMYPPVIYYTGPALWVGDRDAFAARPLTVTGLIKGVGRNFVRMNYYRFLRLLRRWGFLSTPEARIMRWRHFSLRPWRHQYRFRRRP